MPNYRRGLSFVGLGAAAIAAFCFLLTPVANAQPASGNYLATYNAGVDEFNRAARTGNYAKAKELFQRAIKINSARSGPYRYLTVIANNEKAWADCLKQGLAFGKRGLTSKHIDTIRKMHAGCRKSLGMPEFLGSFGGRGAIHVASEPGGGKVKLNGLSLGATPLGPRPFSTGSVDVEVSAEGYLPTKLKAEIVEGFVTDVKVELKKDPNAKTGNGKKPPVTSEVKNGWLTVTLKQTGARLTVDGKSPEIKDNRIELSPGLHVVMVEAADHERWARRVRIAKGQHKTIEVSLRTTASRSANRKKGYLFLGGAAIFGVLGATFGILENDAFEEAQDIHDIESSRPTSGNSEALQPVRTRQDIEDAKSRGNTYKLLQAASLGAAAVALGVSIYYFVQERPAERKGSPLPVAITPLLPSSSGMAGVGAQITYSKALDW